LIPALLAVTGCHNEFVVDVTIERGTLPIPDTVMLLVAETSDAGVTVVGVQGFSLVGAELFAEEGVSNHVRIIVDPEADAVELRAVGYDAAGVELGRGYADAMRASGTVEVTITLGSGDGSDAGVGPDGG
jgi:hypothetical protein